MNSEGARLQRFLGGASVQLDSYFEQAFEEAKKRRFGNLISEQAGGEVVYLLEASSGYKIVYTQRAIAIHEELFVEPEPAFNRWLDEERCSRGLPGNAEL